MWVCYSVATFAANAAQRTTQYRSYATMKEIAEEKAAINNRRNRKLQDKRKERKKANSDSAVKPIIKKEKVKFIVNDNDEVVDLSRIRSIKDVISSDVDL